LWQGKVRRGAAERTLNRLLAETGRLPQASTLTMDLLVADGEQQDPGTRTRQEFLKVAKRLAVLSGKWADVIALGLQLYDIRHAWAARSIRKNLNASLATKTMGHSLDVQHLTYHRWLDQAAAAAGLN
jgi:hypothetical protein